MYNFSFKIRSVSFESYLGFYARITELEDIRSKVFEYVKVLARPMVLYQHEHPIHWSPVYVGGKVCKSKILIFSFNRAFPII